MYNPLCLETAPAKGVLAVAQQGIQVSALPGELLLQLDRPSHQYLRNTVSHDLATIAGAGAFALRISWRGLGCRSGDNEATSTLVYNSSKGAWEVGEGTHGNRGGDMSLPSCWCGGIPAKLPSLAGQ